MTRVSVCHCSFKKITSFRKNGPSVTGVFGHQSLILPSLPTQASLDTRNDIHLEVPWGEVKLPRVEHPREPRAILTWQHGKSTLFNRGYIFKWLDFFHVHVGFIGFAPILVPASIEKSVYLIEGDVVAKVQPHIMYKCRVYIWTYYTYVHVTVFC